MKFWLRFRIHKAFKLWDKQLKDEGKVQFQGVPETGGYFEK